MLNFFILGKFLKIYLCFKIIPNYFQLFLQKNCLNNFEIFFNFFNYFCFLKEFYHFSHHFMFLFILFYFFIFFYIFFLLSIYFHRYCIFLATFNNLANKFLLVVKIILYTFIFLQLIILTMSLSNFFHFFLL